MSTTYIIKESFEGLWRAKTSSILSIAVISFLLILIGIFLIATVNISRLIEIAHAGIDMEVFISNALDDKEIATLEAEINKIPGVAKVEFISKTAAAKIFQKEFGEDVFDILENNPLPSSFKIEIDRKQDTPENARTVASQIEKLNGVDEVVYRRGLLDVLEKYAKMTIEIDIILGVLVGLGSLLIVANTIRLIILAKREVLEAMQLVGATRWFVRCPFLIEGCIQGILGGLIAAGIINITVVFLNIEIPSFIIIDTYIYILLIILGFGMGIIGSLLATHKFIK